MTWEDLAKLEGLNTKLLDELANVQLPPTFMLGLAKALPLSDYNFLFDSPESFACFRIGYVVAHEMIKRKNAQ